MSRADKVQRLESMLVRVLARKDITRIRPQPAPTGPAPRMAPSKSAALESLMGPAMDLGADDLSEVPTSLIQGHLAPGDDVLASPEPAFQIEGRARVFEPAAPAPVSEAPAAPLPDEELPSLSDEAPGLALAVEPATPEVAEALAPQSLPPAPEEPAPLVSEAATVPPAELIEVPEEPAAQLIEVPEEPAAELIEVPEEPAAELIEVSDADSSVLIEITDESAAELIEVTEEPAAELIEVPEEPVAEPAAELIEVPEEPVVEPAAELIEVPEEPVVEPAAELIEVPEEPVSEASRETVEPEEFDLAVEGSMQPEVLHHTPPPPLPVGLPVEDVPAIAAVAVPDLQRIRESIPAPKEPESLKPPRDPSTPPASLESVRPEVFAPAALPEMPGYVRVVAPVAPERPRTLRGMMERALSLRPRR